MKSLSFLLLFLCASPAAAQTVPSSCDAPDSVKEKFARDAENLAWRRLAEIGLPLADSQVASIEWRDSVLRPLLAVYNSGIPAADTVCMKIPVWLQNEYDSLHIGASSDKTLGLHLLLDTSFKWAENFRLWAMGLGDSLHPSGNVTIDSLIQRFQLYPFSYYSNYSLEVTCTTKNVNAVFALAKAFEKVEGVVQVYSLFGGRFNGTEIVQLISDSVTSVLYSYGWGDCPSGCMYARSWQFTVFPDCSVRLDSSYGNALPVLSVHEPVQNTLSLYPNPVTDKLIIEAEERGTAIISDVSGKEVRTATLSEGKNELVVSDLPSGMYFVAIRDKNGNVSTGRFIKM